ncbi:MAG: hypothetical protein HRT45_05775 [Bdellovibrionales bacterium]|nr:hypothetical protein [Bdellovibrionales bacterium]
MSLSVALFCCLFSTKSFACVWNSAIDPVFLNTSPIPICLNAPTDVDQSDHFAQFRETETLVRQAIRSMAAQTSLSFEIQQGYCGTDAESLEKPMMRILLNPETNTGQAFPDEGFANYQRNLSIPFLNPDGSARSYSNLAFITQHEILHLLGIQHDDRSFGSPADIQKRRDAHPNILDLTNEHAELSVMNIMSDELTPLMTGQSFRQNMEITPEDNTCIDLVFERHRQNRPTPLLPADETR